MSELLARLRQLAADLQDDGDARASEDMRLAVSEIERLRAALQQIADEPRQPLGDGRRWAYQLHQIACSAIAGGRTP